MAMRLIPVCLFDINQQPGALKPVHAGKGTWEPTQAQHSPPRDILIPDAGS